MVAPFNAALVKGLRDDQIVLLSTMIKSEPTGMLPEILEKEQLRWEIAQLPTSASLSSPAARPRAAKWGK
jgi:hypothetical protein